MKSNFLISTADNKLIPHHQEFAKNWAKIDLSEKFKHYNFLVAGGWALTVLAAPRNSITRNIEFGYYTDIDLFPMTYHHIHRMYMDLNYTTYCERLHTSDLSYSYTYQGHLIQVVKKHKEDKEPHEILQEFDFINCAIGYNPNKDEIYFHKDLIKYHLADILALQHPADFYKKQFEDPAYFKAFVKRTEKYTDRWNYTIAEPHKQIIEEYGLLYPGCLSGDILQNPFYKPAVPRTLL